ncbi:MAG: RpiB/LacA/LacB family sugar-phosphate isomerase [Anaerolineales bacterium]|nr:RpiB/LacA/LacB family sugar-phosphate isomerase [Anaerolineales bacterium]
MKRLAIAADHGGFVLKSRLIEVAQGLGWETLDLGTDSADHPVDYPDSAKAVGLELQAGRAERGIVLCGSGVGACIAANKMRGIRAGVCHDTYSAHQGVEHDDMNVLCVGARIIGSELASEITRAFLGATFQNEERLVRRLNKVKALEQGGPQPGDR